MDREVCVYVDLQGTPYLVGRLWAPLRKDRVTATFDYDRTWLAHGERFSLELALKLGPGPLHTAADRPLFGDIGDSAPDRWGRVPGSSLGGARPKASVRDGDGHVLIAKFPNKADEVNTVAWEAGALTLAAKAGIPVSPWRMETIGTKPVLLLRRFDRQPSMLRQHGAEPKRDMHALWRRIVFSILISNTDDHLRNHRFLWAVSTGGRLSPAYDLNPVPADVKPRVLTTAIDPDDGTASLKLAYAVASYFELKPAEAHAIAREVGRVVDDWRKEATRLSLGKPELDRMASAFEHDDLRFALAG